MKDQQSSYSSRHVAGVHPILLSNRGPKDGNPGYSFGEKWDEQQVQRFLCSHMNGRYKHLASSFKMVDGLQVYNLTESQMKDICGKALGSALYQNLHPESKRNGKRPYYGDDAGSISLRNDSELEDQLNFIVAQRCRRSLLPHRSRPS